MLDNDASSAEVTPEAALLRLFRCMTEAEQAELFESALQMLGQRNTFDPFHTYCRPEDIQSELANADLNDRLMAAWPADWPGRQIVDLDDVGDPGAWLCGSLPECPISCLFPPGNEEWIAGGLAENYLAEIRGQGFPLPSDFGDNPDYQGWTEEDEKQVRAEFVAFLKHWRERVLTTLEGQNPPKHGGGA